MHFESDIKLAEEKLGAIFPEQYKELAIGDDGSGDILCFKKTNGKMGDTVYLWNHETTELNEYAPLQCTVVLY